MLHAIADHKQHASIFQARFILKGYGISDGRVSQDNKLYSKVLPFRCNIVIFVSVVITILLPHRRNIEVLFAFTPKYAKVVMKNI